MRSCFDVYNEISTRTCTQSPHILAVVGSFPALFVILLIEREIGNYVIFVMGHKSTDETCGSTSIAHCLPITYAISGSSTLATTLLAIMWIR